MTPSLAARSHRLNIYERGEILDYRNVYFCGKPGIKKISGDIRAIPLTTMALTTVMVIIMLFLATILLTVMKFLVFLVKEALEKFSNVSTTKLENLLRLSSLSTGNGFTFKLSLRQIFCVCYHNGTLKINII